MAGVWNAIVTAVLRTRDKDEKLRKENARIDREIASKKLEIKKIKTNVRNYRKDKFHDKLEKLPAQVTVVNIDGLSRTSDKLVMSKVQKLFDVESFQQILKIGGEVQDDLKSLGCFKQVDMTVDTMTEDDTHYKVNINVKETESLFANIGVVCDNPDQIAGVVRFGLNNIGGGGERGEVEIGKGREGYSLTNISIEKPLHFLPEGSNISAFTRRENMKIQHFHSSVTEFVVGSAFSFAAFSEAFSFVSSLDASWLSTKYNFKHLDQLGSAEWDPLVQYSGDILRTSLSNWLSLDLRDDPLLPEHGLLLSAGHKLSSNNFGHHAHEVTISSSLHHPLVPGLSLSWRSLYSHVWGSYSPLPQELPHYRTGLLARGLTIPYQYQGDPTTFISILAITSNLPLLSGNSFLGQHVKFHNFFTAHSQKVHFNENLQLQNISLSFGVGFVGRFLDFGRLELNYCVPFSCFGGQGENKSGLQFSFGTEFL